MTTILNSLRVRSGRRELVDAVSLSLAPGSRTALVGSSGAGKSLTCGALAGTLPAGLDVTGILTITPTDDDSATKAAQGPAGTAGADGAKGAGDRFDNSERPDLPNLLNVPAAMRPPGSRIALVQQDPTTALHPLIPVCRQIGLVARAAGHSADAAAVRAVDLLYAVGLDESIGSRVPGRLSGGQRQRAGLALALAGEPAVIIADEPTTALDVIARAEVLGLLTEITRIPAAPALLLITHDLPAATVCENITVLHRGAVVDSGPTAEVLSNPTDPVTVAMCEAAADETLTGALAAVALHDAEGEAA